MLSAPASIAVCVILAVLAVFQVALIAGAPIGRFAWGGQNDVLPTRTRIGSAISIVIYAIIALLVLDRAALIDIVPDVVSSIGTWMVTAYFALGVVLNGISRSKPERYTMAPLSLIVAVLCLLVALS